MEHSWSGAHSSQRSFDLSLTAQPVGRLDGAAGRGAHGLNSLIASQQRRAVRTRAFKVLSWPRPSARSATY